MKGLGCKTEMFKCLIDVEELLIQLRCDLAYKQVFDRLAGDGELSGQDCWLVQDRRDDIGLTGLDCFVNLRS